MFLPVFLIFPFTFASYYNPRLLSAYNAKNEAALVFSTYYFPKKTREKLINDVCQDNSINDHAIYEVAATEIVDLDKNLFQNSLTCWKMKHSLKKFWRIEDISWDARQLPFITLEDFILTHYTENLGIIKNHGYGQEMISEMYYGFKLMQGWNRYAAWSLSRFIFGLMYCDTLKMLGPTTEEERTEYNRLQINIPLSAAADLQSYLAVFASNVSFSERIVYARAVEENSNLSIAEKDSAIARLFNPFGFDPSAQENVFRNAIALQQWKYFQNFRLKHLHKSLHASLESIILSMSANAHYRILLRKCHEYPKFRELASRHFQKSLIWTQPHEEDLIIFPLVPDLKFKLKVSAQEFYGMFGLPGPLRVFIFMRMQDDLNVNFGTFVETEYLVAAGQRSILLAVLNGKIPEKINNLEMVDDGLKKVCVAWIAYWRFLVSKLGHVNHQTSSTLFLDSLSRDYFNSGISPVKFTRQSFLGAIEAAILCEGNFFVGFAKLLEEKSEDIKMLINLYEAYERELVNYFRNKGLYLSAFEANKIKIAIEKYEISFFN